MGNFDKAITAVLNEEGGYVNDPDDPGGETKYGISKRYHPDVDIANLTIDKAKEIYRDEYWNPFGLDQIESPKLSERVLSCLVNIGAYNAFVCLQNALRAAGMYVSVDGKFGPETENAVRRADNLSLLAAFKSEWAGWYRTQVARFPEKKKYLQGWLSRAYR